MRYVCYDSCILHIINNSNTLSSKNYHTIKYIYFNYDLHDDHASIDVTRAIDNYYDTDFYTHNFTFSWCIIFYFNPIACSISMNELFSVATAKFINICILEMNKSLSKFFVILTFLLFRGYRLKDLSLISSIIQTIRFVWFVLYNSMFLLSHYRE